MRCEGNLLIKPLLENNMKKIVISKCLLVVCLLSLFTANAKVFAENSIRNESVTIKHIQGQLFSDSESGGGGGGKTCATDKCEKVIVKGIPPYQVTSTFYGSYSHCVEASSGSCNSSSCDKQCDAGISGGH